jgi:hypothetical protein
MNKILIFLFFSFVIISSYFILKEDKPIGTIVQKQDELKIIYPKDLENVNGAIEIRGVAEENFDLIEIQIDLNGWNKAQGVKKWNYFLETSDLEKGIHTIYVRASNKDHNKIKAVRIKIE